MNSPQLCSLFTSLNSSNFVSVVVAMNFQKMDAKNLSEWYQNSKLEEGEIDDDQDYSNPQFIPRKGPYFFHDDRTKNQRKNEENKKFKKFHQKNRFQRRRNFDLRWKIESKRWTHDLYNDERRQLRYDAG